MALKTALQGKVLRGSIDFAAETEKVVDLSQGGFAQGGFAVAGIPLVRQLDTVQVDGVVDNEDYTVTLNGVAFTIDSGAGATATTIRDALVAAINAGSVPVTAAPSGADLLTLTADVAGVGFTLTVAATGAATLAITSQSLDTTLGNFGVVAKDGAQFTLRTSAAFTGSIDVAVVG